MIFIICNYIANNYMLVIMLVIIVTGSTQGSGAETAKLLAHRGAKGITICGRKEKEGLEIKGDIEKIGSECIYVKADLSKEEDCRHIVNLTDATFGKVNSLINVANSQFKCF